MALEFIITLTSNNETILKKIGEKISLMDETSLLNLNQLMDFEITTHSHKETEDKDAKFYSIAKNLLIKNKKTTLEAQMKINAKILEKIDEKMEPPKEEIGLKRRRSFSSKDSLHTYKVSITSKINKLFFFILKRKTLFFYSS